MNRLQGKTALITGAASGIGRASAKLFAGEGAAVVLFDRAEAVHETARMVTDAGGRAVSLTGDAGEERDIEGAVAQAVSAFGGLDIAFANAGVSGGLTALADQTGAFWLDLLRINLVGPFLIIKHAGKHMAARGKGSIVCTASVAGLRSGAGGAPYSASKAGVINLVQTSAQQMAGTGVRGERHLPRPDRDRHDRAHVRPGAGERDRSQARPAQSLASRRPAGGDRPGGAVPGVGRRLLCERPGHCGGRRPLQLPPDRPAGGDVIAPSTLGWGGQKRLTFLANRRKVAAWWTPPASSP